MSSHTCSEVFGDLCLFESHRTSKLFLLDDGREHHLAYLRLNHSPEFLLLLDSKVVFLSELIDDPTDVLASVNNDFGCFALTKVHI